MPPISNRKLALQEFVKRLRENLSTNVVDVRLYGSEARGNATSESDIDVLVVVQPDDERDRLQTRIVDIAFDVNLEFDVYISPFVISPEILNHPVWRKPPFHRDRAARGRSAVTAQDELARHRLRRARETLETADLLFDRRHYNAALNRVYYAAFYPISH